MDPRRRLALLVPVLLLAACGSGGGGGGNGQGSARPVAGPASFDRADGSLDRARYRIAAVRSCVEGMRAAGAGIPEDVIARNCSCLIDRQLEANSDEVLRASIGDDAVNRRTLDAASRQCGLPVPTDEDLGLNAANSAGVLPPPPPPPPEPVPPPAR